MGGHSIDFVQDSRRRRRRRRGQPDPPLVVPTRLQHRPPPHIPPRLVSYSFSFEHRHDPNPLARLSRSLARRIPLSLSLSLSFVLAPRLSHFVSFSLSPAFCLLPSFLFLLSLFFEPMLSSCRSCSQQALDKMPLASPVSEHPRFVDLFYRHVAGIKRIVRSIADRVCESRE